MQRAMEFTPDVIIFDRMEREGFDPETIEALKSLGYVN